MLHFWREQGAKRLLELQLERPVQFLLFMFHFNELPLKHLGLHIDDTTSRPSTFSGNIGKALAKCHILSIVKFDARQNNLSNDLHEDVTRNRSKDQLYLNYICKAMELGKVTESLAKKEPTPLLHSRWLTTANGMLRLYAVDTLLSKELVILTGWWRLIQFSRFLSESYRLVVDKCI